MTTAYNANIPYDSTINYDGGTSVVTPEILPSITIDVSPKGTSDVFPLPEATVNSVSFEDSSPSAIEFSVPDNSINSNKCGDYSVVSLSVNGKYIRDGEFLLRNRGWNAGDRGGVRTYSGKALLWDRLNYTTIQPGRSYKYQRKSPGHILNDIFTEAQNRGVGYWENFYWNFDDETDSNGYAWPTVIDIEYLVTAKYDDIIANLVDKGLIEIHLNAGEIEVFVAQSSGTITDALLVLGKDLGTAPQQASAENIVSDVTVLGDDGIAVTRSNADTRAAYWREEAGVSQGGTKDETTLSLFGDVALSGGGVPKVQRQYELVITHERPFLPLRDYNVGDWVNVLHSDEGRMSLRVKQLVLKQAKKTWTGTLTLNDRFLESEIRLAKKVAGIIGGATITGSSQSSMPDDLKDTGIPAKMTGLALSTDVIQDNTGQTRAMVIVNWDEVTHNSDGTVATDMGTYFLNWRYNDMPANSWTEIEVLHPQSNYVIGGIDPGREVLVYVYSKDNNGHQGSWTGIESIRAESDIIPPSKPSAPWGSSLLRMLIIEFTGLADSGAEMEPDFDHVEVWSSTVNDFDPDTVGDYHGTIRGPGQMYVPAYSYLPGTMVYVKFIAVDRTGNRSVPSNQWNGPIVGVQGPDLVANSVTTNQLAAGAVTAQKIAAGAITAEKINVGQTENLVPDPSFNNAEWRARRLTTEWAERPEKWFFRNDMGFQRNGYWLQALSNPVGENGGRMYMTDWISTMLGESYYFGIWMITGAGLPNDEATMTMGVEVTHADGTVQSDGINYAPMQGIWTKYGYRFTIANSAWVKVRFFLRANNLWAGDIAVDDVEVRGGVGTTASAGSRGLLDALGLFAWDATETQTFMLDFRTGDFTAKGQIQSGFTGKRTIINPGATYLPEIRFYPQTGDTYAYVNASDNGTFPFIGVNAPDIGPSSNAMVLFDQSWVIGEINKASGDSAGPSITGQAGVSGALFLEGVMPNTAWNGRAMLSAWRFNCGSSPQVITKPFNPSAGFFAPVLTPQRITTGTGYTWHIGSMSNASYEIYSSTVSPNPRFTELMIRVAAS